MRRLGWCLLLALLLPLPSRAAELPQAAAAAAARQDVEAVVQEQEQTLMQLRHERQTLAAQLKEVNATLASETAALDRQRDALTQLRAQHRQQAEALKADERGLAQLESTVRSSAREAGPLLAASPLALDHPEALARWTALADGDAPVDFAAVRDLAAALQQEAATNGRPQRRTTSYAAADGRLVTGEVVSLGPFLSLADPDGSVRWLVTDPQLGRLRVAGPDPGWSRQRQLDRYWQGEGEVLPLDLSRGETLRQPAAAGGWLGTLRAGGVLVWPILLIGAVALLLVLERLLVLWRLRADTGALAAEARQALVAGQPEACRDICRRHRRNPAAAVLAAGLDHAGQGLETLENAFHEAILRQLPRLERFLPTLSVLGAVAPLLGLLGTVTGMISTFRALTLHGGGQPGLLSGGISEALITTQLGLAVAIPVLLLHHFLERRVERLVDEMEATAVTFTRPLLGEKEAS